MKGNHNPENAAQTQLDNGLAKASAVKPGWTTGETEKIIGSLNQLLANYSVHYQKLRAYHWNIKGSDFFDLHQEFEVQYREALENIDQTAERIRFFGGIPLSSLSDYLNVSEIKETGGQMRSELMVRELLGDYRLLLECMYSVVKVAAANHDTGTQEMTNLFIRAVEKHHWMLTAFLAK